MYNIADFLFVQLRVSRFTLMKSSQSSHVCLNYISTAQFLSTRQSEYQMSSLHQSLSEGKFRFRLAGIFSADFWRTKIWLGNQMRL